jgi:ATP-binding cassette, subfamily B, bacterial
MKQPDGYRSISTFLWSVIRPYKWYYFVMILAPTLSAFYDFANNYALKLIIDAFSSESDVTYKSLLLPITIFITAQILLDVIWRVADVAEWRSEPFVRKAILTRVYDFVQHKPYQFFQNTQGGIITSQVKGILDGYDNFWAAMHHDFTPRLANAVVLTSTLAIVNIKVCLFVALWGLSFFIIMYRFSLVLDRLSYINSSYRHRILGLAADNVANIFTIFSFASRRYEHKNLGKAIEKDFIPSNIKVYKFSFFSNIVAAILYWIMLISLFLYMIYLRQERLVTTGDLVFVMGISLKMSWELWQLIHKMQVFMKNIGDFKSAFALLKSPKDPIESRKHPEIQISKPSIAFEHVTFSYSADTPVFYDLSFSIRAGEKIGLVGISGAGKSTLVSLLLGYFHLDAGRILIDDKNIADFSVDSVRENIALIPQDIMLFHRSIFENIKYGRLSASEEEVIAAARIANIHDFIETLPEKYDSMVGERGIKLSGGQRQRIAIARAILKNAPILILDEATSSLDTNTERLIQLSLMRLLHNSNTTVIAIAHRLSTVKHLDRIIVLENGKIVDQGSHEVLIKTSILYKNLWEIQKL